MGIWTATQREAIDKLIADGWEISATREGDGTVAVQGKRGEKETVVGSIGRRGKVDLYFVSVRYSKLTTKRVKGRTELKMTNGAAP